MRVLILILLLAYVIVVAVEYEVGCVGVCAWAEVVVGG